MPIKMSKSLRRASEKIVKKIKPATHSKAEAQSSTEQHEVLHFNDGPSPSTTLLPDVQNSELPTATTASLPIERRGLFELARPPAGHAIDVDIVAVHGLMGDPFETWTKDGKLWLRDFVPEQLPDARIFTFGYNSSVAFSSSVSGIDDFARDLLLRLELERSAASEDRPPPIVFVCHSLGGIVVKKALIIAHEESPNHYEDILENVKGIAFLGVPHRGASIARLGDFFAKVLKAATLGKTTNSSLTSDLRQSSKTLKDISAQAVHRLNHLQVLSFFEREKTWGELIVDEDSGRLQIPKERAIPVEADHRNICRFSSSMNQNYKLVGGYVVRLVNDIVGVRSALQVQTKSKAPVKFLESVCVTPWLLLNLCSRSLA